MFGMKIVLWTVAGAVTLSACGCDLFLAHERREERPVIVEQRPVYVEPQRVIVVERAPPPPAPLLEVHVH